MIGKEREHLFSKVNHSNTCHSKNLYLTYANASESYIKNDARKS